MSPSKSGTYFTLKATGQSALPGTLNITAASKALFERGLPNQGYLVLIDLKACNLHLLPAFNHHDGLLRVDNTGTAYLEHEFVDVATPRGQLSTVLSPHGEAALTLGLDHLIADGYLLGGAIWKGGVGLRMINLAASGKKTLSEVSGYVPDEVALVYVQGKWRVTYTTASEEPSNNYRACCIMSKMIPNLDALLFSNNPDDYDHSKRLKIRHCIIEFLVNSLNYTIDMPVIKKIRFVSTSINSRAIRIDPVAHWLLEMSFGTHSVHVRQVERELPEELAEPILKTLTQLGDSQGFSMSGLRRYVSSSEQEHWYNSRTLFNRIGKDGIFNLISEAIERGSYQGGALAQFIQLDSVIYRSDILKSKLALFVRSAAFVEDVLQGAHKGYLQMLGLSAIAADDCVLLERVLNAGKLVESMLVNLATVSARIYCADHHCAMRHIDVLLNYANRTNMQRAVSELERVRMCYAEKRIAVNMLVEAMMMDAIAERLAREAAGDVIPPLVPYQANAIRQIKSSIKMTPLQKSKFEFIHQYLADNELSDGVSILATSPTFFDQGSYGLYEIIQRQFFPARLFDGDDLIELSDATVHAEIMFQLHTNPSYQQLKACLCTGLIHEKSMRRTDYIREVYDAYQELLHYASPEQVQAAQVFIETLENHPNFPSSALSLHQTLKSAASRQYAELCHAEQVEMLVGMLYYNELRVDDCEWIYTGAKQPEELLGYLKAVLAASELPMQSDTDASDDDELPSLELKDIVAGLEKIMLTKSGMQNDDISSMPRMNRGT